MQEEYPLYPKLAPEAEAEAQALMDGFKEQMLKLCQATLSQLYCDVSAYIESDHWTNYRNDLLAGLQNYGNRKVQASYDFAKIRRAIFEEYRDEIVSDLNQDLLAEIERLKDQLERERELAQMRS
jgi:hypothetical protein